jgi:hypothetical protein
MHKTVLLSAILSVFSLCVKAEDKTTTVEGTFSMEVKNGDVKAVKLIPNTPKGTATDHKEHLKAAIDNNEQKEKTPETLFFGALAKHLFSTYMESHRRAGD